MMPPRLEMGATEFIRWHEWQGTRDLAAFLATPAAIAFQQEYHWEEVRRRCRALALETRQRVNALTGLGPICPSGPEWLGQMVTVRLPEGNAEAFGRRLGEESHIEVPVFEWNGQTFLRASIQGYNSPEDADALVGALAHMLAHG